MAYRRAISYRAQVFETRHAGGATLPRHRHDVAYVAIVLEGAYTELHGDAPCRCRKGTLVLHGIAEEHADHFTSETLYLNIELQDVRVPNPTGRVFENAPMIGQLVDAVVGAFYARRERALLDAAGDLERALTQDVSPKPPIDAPAWLLASLRDFDWTDSIPLREAAERANVYPTHYSRAFRRHLGMTPQAYRMERRIALASCLLLETAAPLASVAQQCGFADQSHLTRDFGSATALAPAAFRRAFAG